MDADSLQNTQVQRRFTGLVFKKLQLVVSLTLASIELECLCAIQFWV
jgi:hypothetical protein